MSTKLTWVADYLHSSIPISSLEKRVISTQLFNRLHNILQNATVYLTYPCCRTSRFSHSLGATHLAGEIFRHAILNATADHRTRFLDLLYKEIRVLDQTEAFRQDVDNHLPQVDDATLAGFDCSELTDPLYAAALPGSVQHGQDAYSYYIFFQAIRLVALMHDLGHPPFSHIAEFALGEVASLIRDKKAAGTSLTRRETRFLRIIAPYQSEHLVFHEGLTARLAQHVLSDLVAHIAPDRLRFDTLRIKHVALAILNESSSTLAALHEIVAGPLDADRLDYVPRDLTMSGQSNGVPDYARLVGSYQLIYVGDAPKILPSVRVLSAIEEFFRGRLDLYKYVVYHHRVAKTDGLLKDVIVQLSQEYLALDEEEPDGTKMLPRDMSGLWSVLDPDNTLFRTQRIFQYIQWDDAWLLSVLRTHYLGLDKSKREGRLGVQLEEFLSNRKHYHSLYHRVDSFVPVDEAFLNAIPVDFSWRELGEAITREMAPEVTRAGSPFDRSLRDLTDYHARYVEDRSRVAALREEFGFFLVSLQQLLTIVGQTGLSPNLSFLYLVRPALDALRDAADLTDVIAMPKTLRSGITGQFEMVNEGVVVRLSAVSRLAEELARTCRFFPPFYVYVYRARGVENDELTSMRSLFGRELWRHISSQLTGTEVSRV